MYEVGTRVTGLAVPVVGEVQLGIGKIFQIRVQCQQGIINPESAAVFLLGKLREQYPEIEVVWMRVCERDQTIDFQFATLPAESLGFEPRVQRLFIGALLAWLPMILTLIGITAVAVSAWNILAGIPWYIWAILGTGVVLLLFGPAISRAIGGAAPEKYRAPVFVFPKPPEYERW